MVGKGKRAVVVDPYDDSPTLSPSLASAQRPDQKYHLYPADDQSIFDHFQPPDISEPFPDIAQITKVLLKTIDR
jgi:hypothetical protein